MHLPYRQICWLLPLALTLSLALFSLPLPRGLNDEVRPKRRLLLFRRRRLLQNFWWHSTLTNLIKFPKITLRHSTGHTHTHAANKLSMQRTT
jgi:hypothetical protein